MSVVWNSRFQKHYSQRILQNEVRETPSIPVRRVRKDVLFDDRHALLPRPVRCFRHQVLASIVQPSLDISNPKRPGKPVFEFICIFGHDGFSHICADT